MEPYRKPAGRRGPPGPPKPSPRSAYITAYGIAVKHGFRGTEAEWLDSLKGTYTSDASYCVEFGEITGSGTLYFTAAYESRPFYHLHTVDPEGQVSQGSAGTVTLVQSGDYYIGVSLSGVEGDTVTLVVCYCSMPVEAAFEIGEEDNTGGGDDDKGENDAEIGGDGQWTLTHQWDLAVSAVDSVTDGEATLSGCVITENGLYFSAAAQSCYLGSIWGTNHAIEIDCGEMTPHSSTGVHLRTFMIYSSSVNKTEGLIWRYQTGAWAFYHDGAWESDLPITDRDYFSGKTVRIESDGEGYLSLYADGELVGTSSLPFAGQTEVSLGSYGASYYQACYRAVRVYAKAE